MYALQKRHKDNETFMNVVTKWNSFSEKIPEFGSYILICNEDGKIAITQYDVPFHKKITKKTKEDLVLKFYSDDDVDSGFIDFTFFWMYTSSISIGEYS